MKSSTAKKVMYVIWITLIVITVSSYNIATKSTDTAMQGTDFPKLENLKGKAEFYFTPSDDNRVWHVVNRYHVLGLNTEQNYNEASYIFSSDSVYVVNEYAGMPNQDELDIALARSLQNENISINQ